MDEKQLNNQDWITWALNQMQNDTTIKVLENDKFIVRRLEQGIDIRSK